MIVKLSPKAIVLDNVELSASFALVLVYSDPQLQASGHSWWFPKLSVWKMPSLVQQGWVLHELEEADQRLGFSQSFFKLSFVSFSWA